MLQLRWQGVRAQYVLHSAVPPVTQDKSTGRQPLQQTPRETHDPDRSANGKRKKTGTKRPSCEVPSACSAFQRAERDAYARAVAAACVGRPASRQGARPV
jgi:hypothetical protein